MSNTDQLQQSELQSQPVSQPHSNEHQQPSESAAVVGEIDFAEILDQLNTIAPRTVPAVGVPLQPVSQPQPQPQPAPQFGQFLGRTTAPPLEQPLGKLLIDTVQSIIPDLAAFDALKNLSEDESKRKLSAVQSIAGKLGVLIAKILDELSDQFENKKLIQTPNGVYYRV